MKGRMKVIWHLNVTNASVSPAVKLILIWPETKNAVLSEVLSLNDWNYPHSLGPLFDLIPNTRSWTLFTRWAIFNSGAESCLFMARSNIASYYQDFCYWLANSNNPALIIRLKMDDVGTNGWSKNSTEKFYLVWMVLSVLVVTNNPRR